MKSLLSVVITLVVVIGGVLVWRTVSAGHQSQPTPTGEVVMEAPLEYESPVHVGDFMKSVDSYDGSVSVAGVVSVVSAEDGLLALIDLREFEECGTTSCASLSLPVRWSGTMPSVANAVQVDGEIERAGEKLVFVAHQIRQRSP